MPKSYTQYVCQQCGRIVARQMGRCPQCGAYNSLVEEVVNPPAPAAKGRPHGLTSVSTPRRLTEIDSLTDARLPLSIGEFARVLGGGIVPGSIVLIGGDPGIGKSTLLLQVALEVAQTATVLYISGEESERQIKMRAERLASLPPGSGSGRPSAPKGKGELPAPPDGEGNTGKGDIFLVTETNLSIMLEQIAEVKPTLVVVD
jgi:DNA repair protein RadA/Sms